LACHLLLLLLLLLPAQAELPCPLGCLLLLLLLKTASQNIQTPHNQQHQWLAGLSVWSTAALQGLLQQQLLLPAAAGVDAAQAVTSEA
jgi:hypothetical protein